jgi:Asp-tRNA(Asn)/Glu-tRNA(Gln) amidotransferase A subunit family amidase
MMTISRRLATCLALSVVAALARPSAQQAAGDLPPFEVFERPILDLQAAMESGDVTSRELVTLYLERITAYDRQGPRLHAMVALNPRALDQAAALDRERAQGRVRGPLHGIPIVVKDNYETVEMPTAAGSIALGSFRTTTDAYQVQRLRDAGVVIIGKTNMHELASGITNMSSLLGPTRNPYDLRRNPGGSSGGTGAAIAASFAAAGMGSDTCGSIRIPAAHHALAGLRGTRGLASNVGIVPLSHTQDIGGPIARTLTDLAIMLDATVGPNPQDPSSARSQGHIPRSYRDALTPGGLEGTRIGVLTALFGSSPEDTEVGDVVRKALNEMQLKYGAQLVNIIVPDLDALLRDSGVIVHEFKFDLADYLAAHPNAPVKSLDEIVSLGLYDDTMERVLTTRNEVKDRNSEAYQKAMAKRDTLRAAILAAMDEQRVVALAYPTIRRKPVAIGEPQPGTNCSLSANSGLPALSVNAGITEDGLPVGIEFLGREWSEPALLHLAYDWDRRKPRLAPTTTPPLIERKPPQPRTWDERAEHLAARFTFDPLTNDLTYDVSVQDLTPEDVVLVALHRGRVKAGDVETRRGIIARLVEPGSLTGRGTVTLRYPFNMELTRGELFVHLYIRTPSLKATRVPLRMR